MQAGNSDGCAMSWLWLSLYHALAMLWATFWALVLGFTISGVLQVFVSKERMSRVFGRTNLKSIAIATGLGGGQQFMLVRGGGSGTKRDPARRGPRSGARLHVRFDQSGDRARGGSLGPDGVAVCARGNRRCLFAYHNHVVADTLVFTEKS
jgi:hypothetical protein